MDTQSKLLNKQYLETRIRELKEIRTKELEFTIEESDRVFSKSLYINFWCKGKEIESIWEKDHLCFIKMKSGKVWICDEFQKISTGVKTWSVRTVEKVTRNVSNNGLTIIQLSQKGKSDRYGKK